MAKILITRDHYEDEYAEIDDALISKLHWDHVSGGISRSANFYSLYGYIPYSKAMEILASSCSGQHDFGWNSAKICIPKIINSKEPYLQTYQKLKEIAGPQPKSISALRHPEGQPPCTRKIMEILSGVPFIIRKDLKTELKKCGFHPDTIRNSLNRLKKQNRIVMEGNSQSPYQKIHLPSQN